MAAESPKFYTPQAALHIPTNRWREIHGEKLEASYTPFNPRKHAAFAQATIGFTLDEVPEKKPYLVQTSDNHGRSSEIRFDDSGLIIWEDEFKNIYGTTTIKGNNFQDPKALVEPHSPSGFIYWGLLDGDSILRQKRASELLRANKIDTEIILRVLEPCTFPLNNKQISVEELKAFMIKNAGKEEVRDSSGWRELRFDETPKLVRALNNTAFFMEVRGLQVAERVADLNDVETEEDFLAICQRVFQFVNLKEEVEAKKENRQPEHFDFKSEQDRFSYFSHYLPKQLGKNYGRFHNLKLLHTYPHTGNISLVGSIYDLDSVAGEPLKIPGEKVVIEDDIIEEVDYLVFGSSDHQLAEGVVNVLGELAEKDFFSDLDSKMGRATVESLFVINFYLNYFEERGWLDDVLGHLPQISDHISSSRYKINGVDLSRVLEGAMLGLALKELEWQDNKLDLPKFLFQYLEKGQSYWLDERKDRIEAALKDKKLAETVIERLGGSWQGFRLINEIIAEEKEKDLEIVEEEYGQDTRNTLEHWYTNKIQVEVQSALRELSKYGQAADEVVLHQLFKILGWDETSLNRGKNKNLLARYQKAKSLNPSKAASYFAEDDYYSEERKAEIYNVVKEFADLHKLQLALFPDTGKDYFNFPDISHEMKQLYRNIQMSDILDILTLWTEGSLKNQISKDYDPRVIGAFLSSLVKEKAEVVAEMSELATPEKDDPDFKIKLARLNEFLELIPGGVDHKTVQKMVYKLFNEGAYDISDELEKRAGISLLGYGIRSRNSHAIFNHGRVDIALNEFGADQIKALEEALIYPEAVDPYMTTSAKEMLKAVLINVYFKAGQMDKLSLFIQSLEKDEDAKESGWFQTLGMQYAFASTDKEKVTDQVLRNTLEAPVSSQQIESTITHLLKADRQIHPNSYLMKQLREVELNIDDVVSIIKTGIDINAGDLTNMDPNLMGILEDKKHKGVLSTQEASSLIMACICFGIDIPKVLQPYFMSDENKKTVTSFISKHHLILKDYKNPYRLMSDYPVEPVYALMSEGIAKLPASIRKLYQDEANIKENLGEIGLAVLETLFERGYFNHYFGTEFGSTKYPEPAISLKEIHDGGWDFWRIVHPDIWNILRLVNPQGLVTFFENKLEDGKVKIEFTNKETGVVGHRDTPISQCLPADIYSALAI